MILFKRYKYIVNYLWKYKKDFQVDCEICNILIEIWHNYIVCKCTDFHWMRHNMWLVIKYWYSLVLIWVTIGNIANVILFCSNITDWLVFNVNISSITAISRNEQIWCINFIFSNNKNKLISLTILCKIKYFQKENCLIEFSHQILRYCRITVTYIYIGSLPHIGLFTYTLYTYVTLKKYILILYKWLQYDTINKVSIKNINYSTKTKYIYTQQLINLYCIYKHVIVPLHTHFYIHI